MKILSLLGIFFSISFLSIAQRGKDGNFDAPTLNSIVNSYTALTVNATIGQTSITVASNTLTNTVLTNSLSPGDLLLIIQMQGASMNIDPMTAIPVAQGGWGSQYTTVIGSTEWWLHLDTWGEVTNYNQAGKYEYVQVASVAGANTINLSCGIVNNYAISGKVQVIRVPRFAQVNVPANTSIVPPAWNGTTGGVVVMEVNGNLTLASNGKIEANGKGFRGGQQTDNVSTSAGPGSVTDTPFPGTYLSDIASEKGEGIGGFTTEYTALYSRYGVSAPANGGGGGHHHNAGGGGGSNAGSGAYTGKGNPDPAYNTMWNLETPAIGGTSSSGGGRGGYSYSTGNQNVSTLGPNKAAWSGDYRRNNGGLGGHPLAADPTRVFMGGGGGAGDRDNNPAMNQEGAGGAGGGIVMLHVYGTITGASATASLIEANGADGLAVNPNNQAAVGTQKLGNDGAGGGGGGGAIIISNGSVSNTIGLNVKGGKGGNQNLSLGAFATVNEADGPGGGGAGGQISITAGTPATSVIGGGNGTSNSTQITAFPPNGATSGGAGISNNGVNFYDLTVGNGSLCSGSGSVTLTATVTGALPAGATVYWYTDPFAGTSVGTGLTFTTPTLNASTTYYVGVCPGDFRKPVQVMIGSNPVISGMAVISNVTCAGNNGSVTGLTASGGTPAYTYSWNGTVTPSANLTNSAAGSFTLTVTDAAGCTATSGPHQINSAGGPVINTTAMVITNATCAGNNGSITGITQTGGTTFSWSNSGGSNLNATNLAAGTYTLTVTDAASCVATAGPFTVTAPAGPTINAASMVITPANCGNATGSITGITATGTGLTYAWSNSTATTLNLTNAAAGTYTLTVTDNAGCSATSGPHTITSTPGVAVNAAAVVITAETCNLNNGKIEGIVTSGGAAPISYAWTNTTQTTLNLSNLDAGSYTLTVTDGNGCTAVSGPHTVSNTPLPVINTASMNITNESCAGNDGAITGITVTGTGLTYAWNGTAGTLNLAGATAGIYTLTVTDGNNCTVTSGPHTINGSIPMSINMTNAVATATACTSNTGSISGITITGGVSPTFTWSNGATTLNQTGLAAGTYTITANDQQGCTDVETVTIASGTGPVIGTVGLVVTQATCGNSNGSIQGLTQTAPGVTYSWTGTTQTTLDLSGLGGGSYTLTATGADGCTGQFGPVVINNSANPIANFSYSPEDVNPGDAVQFTDLSSNDVTGWSWSINGGTSNAENPTTTFVSEGSYPVVLTVTNLAGCSNSITKIIEVYNEMTIPNVLTMNQDGINDKFEIKGLESNTELEIVNRWGNIVFKTSNYQNDWTGNDLTGEKLSDGVYTYYIRTAKGDSKQGFVHLID